MSKTNIEIINPVEYPGWDDLLLTNPDTTFFHTSGWCQVLTESYGYKPLYFTQIENDKLTGLIAVMEINSWLTGKRGVSLPFSDQVEPIAKDKTEFKKLFDHTISYGQTAGWKGIELRGGYRFLGNCTPADTFKTHVLDIEKNEDNILVSFRGNTRRNIKKAKKSELNISESRDFESIKKFYRLNCLTRKEHGLPPQPFFFFQKIFDYLIAHEKGAIILAYNRLKTSVAGALFSTFNDQVIFKYGASDKDWHNLRPNNLVLWEAIKSYSTNGYKSFDFGRTDIDHKGLLQFKKGWGTMENTLHYYNYDLSKKQFVKKYPKIKTSYPIFKNMPMPILKLAGWILYKHMG